MGGEWAKDRMRISSGVHGFLQVDMEMADRLSNRPHGFLRLVHDSRGAFLLPGVKLGEFALDFGFDGFGGVLVVQDRFKFELLAAQRPDGIGVVEGEISLLEDGVAGQDHGFARGWVHDFRFGRAVEELAEIGHALDLKRHAVDGFGGRVEEEVGDVVRALLVVEARFLAVEGQGPEPQVPADAVLGVRGQRADVRVQTTGAWGQRSDISGQRTAPGRTGRADRTDFEW